MSRFINRLTIALTNRATKKDIGAFIVEPLIAIIPEPSILRVLPGCFRLKHLAWYSEIEPEEYMAVFGEKIQASGLNCTRCTVENKANLVCRIDLSAFVRPDVNNVNKDAYSLTVCPTGIKITAVAESGIFYGLQTLLQLMPPQIYNPEENIGFVDIPLIEIIDEPRFAWRGLLIDVSRHFFSKDFIKKQIELMAIHKLNRLHLHLTDDPAWRIQIDKYPKLTEFSANYYSKSDIREIVSYARRHYIELIPEIDMPGHGGAASRTYPEYFAGDVTFNIANNTTYSFITEILSEVIELFPAKYIHFGGDEVRGEDLQQVAEFSQFLQAKKLSDVKELQAYFYRYIADWLRDKNKNPIVWDEAVNSNLPRDTIIQWWRGRCPDNLDYALTQGHSVIISPGNYLYFDYPQAPGEPGAPWEGNDNGPTTLELLYNWEPVPSYYPAAYRSRILGLEAAVWTEFIQSEEYFEYMAYPRLAALAEKSWSLSGHSDYRSFCQRIKQQYLRYDYLGVHYRMAEDEKGVSKNGVQYLIN